jgi:hypothetical protein
VARARRVTGHLVHPGRREPGAPTLIADGPTGRGCSQLLRRCAHVHGLLRSRGTRLRRAGASAHRRHAVCRPVGTETAWPSTTIVIAFG